MKTPTSAQRAKVNRVAVVINCRSMAILSIFRQPVADACAEQVPSPPCEAELSEKVERSTRIFEFAPP